jgi:hypothetical protein
VRLGFGDIRARLPRSILGGTTMGIMAVGFAMMLCGANGARAVARVFIQRPVQLLVSHARMSIAATIVGLWSLIVRS